MTARAIWVGAFMCAFFGTPSLAQEKRRSVVQPWLGASVGIAKLPFGGSTVIGPGFDLVGGVELGGGLRLGARVMHHSAFVLFGDSPSRSAGTLLLVAGYAPPRWPMSFTAGMGNLAVTEESRQIAWAPVLETGFEFFVPPRHGFSLRGFGAYLWPTGKTRFREPTTWRPAIGTQVQVGLGFLLH